MAKFLNHLCAKLVDDRVALSSDPNIFLPDEVDYEPSSVNFPRNPDCWAFDFDFSPLAVCNSYTGCPTMCGMHRRRGGTLITPRHAVLAAHHGMTGESLYFVDANNNGVWRTITQRYDFRAGQNPDGYSFDVQLVQLDSDVPSHIKFAKVLPSNWYDYLTTSSNYAVPVVGACIGMNIPRYADDYDHNPANCVLHNSKQARANDLGAFYHDESYVDVYPIKPTSGNRLAAWGDICNLSYGGDSGQPVFLYFAVDDPILLGFNTMSDSGKAAINARIAAFTGNGGYQLTVADFSRCAYEKVINRDVIVLYSASNTESEEFADHYIEQHDLEDCQKVALTCDNDEILSDYDEFKTQIEDTVNDTLEYLTSDEGVCAVKNIVVGYGVPAGFYDGDDIITTASRLANIRSTFSKKTANPLYNRQVYKAYDADDAERALVVGRIDAPTLDEAKALVNRSLIIKRQKFANGKFYFDPYSDRHGRGATEYTDSLLAFQSSLLPKLNLETWSTTFLDPYVDVIIPSVQNDSFIWSWFNDRGSNSFFKTSNTFRFFAYNGDYDGAFTLRDARNRRWPYLYLKNGYASTAGAMSDPTIAGLLNPNAFFEALRRGASVGEAYLYAVPYLDWTMTLIGDPLMTVSFPVQSDIEDDTVLSEMESWRLMLNELARSIAYAMRRTDLLEEARDQIVLSSDIATEVDMLLKSESLLNSFNDVRRQGQFSRLTETLLTHIQRRIQGEDRAVPFKTVSDYLLEKEIKVSELIYDCQMNDNKLVLENVAPEGSWEFEFVIGDESNDFASYQFELDIALDPDFEELLFEKKTLEGNTGWYWEKDKNKFEAFPAGGVPSSHVGRRIRYIAQPSEYLTRGDVIYIRWRQRDQAQIFDYQEARDIIFT